MRLQKIILVILMIGFTCSLQAQSESELNSKPKFEFPSQKGKHTLSFYPLHLTYYLGYYSGAPYSPIPAIGYDYHFKNKWSLQAKLFYRQFDDSLFGAIASSIVEQNIKFGIQYYCVNKKFLVTLRMAAFLEKRNSKELIRSLEGEKVRYLKENEHGMDLSLGLGYRFTEQARITMGIALRVGTVKEIVPRGGSFNIALGSPIETLGFGYTF